ncbi:MAG: hypothetical protein JNJ88_12390 [Planctomycetes bacterium]|nr:hypothetical protein [Planctomycetota bacterium]
MRSQSELLTDLLLKLLQAADEVPEWARDRDQAIAEFLGGRDADPGSVARAQEWYLFERRSPRLGDVPPLVLLAERLEGSLEPQAQELLEEMGSSLYSVFETIEGDADRAVVRDLLTGRHCEVEGDLEGAREPGSLLVGRLFPDRSGRYAVSPASLVLTGDVASAVRMDLEAAASTARRGHLSQREMEATLFGVGGRTQEATSAGEGSSAEALEPLEAEVAQWLETAGIGPRGDRGIDLEEVRAMFESAATLGEAVGPILDAVAFESDADLEVGRRLLPAYYAALHAKGRQPQSGTTKRRQVSSASPASRVCPCGSGLEYSSCCRARDAVAQFDAGRARGEDLDSLIRSLEDAMGIEHEEEIEDEWDLERASRPERSEFEDPPIAPLVAEYLWERQQMGRPADDTEAESLLALARSVDTGPGAPADAGGVLREHLERFFSVERFLDSRPPAKGTLEKDLAALDEFSQWLLAEQDIDWRPLVKSCAEGTVSQAARLAQLHAAAQPETPEFLASAPRFRVQQVGSERALVESTIPGEEARSVALSPEQRLLLRAGDCLLLGGRGDNARVLRVLPGTAWPFLVEGSILSRDRSNPREFEG